jgi:hypothetical protein
MIVRIEDLTGEAEVGKYYDVPCAYSQVWGSAKRPMLVPLYGPRHEDREFINFPEEHYHIDWRFADQGFYNSRSRPYRTLWGTVMSARNIKDGQLLPYIDPHQVPWLPKLEAAYAGHRLKDCRTCPHRGLSLRSVVPEDGTISKGSLVIDQIIVCPGHGLAWNARTGELVPRV